MDDWHYRLTDSDSGMSVAAVVLGSRYGVAFDNECEAPYIELSGDANGRTARDIAFEVLRERIMVKGNQSEEDRLP